MSDQERDTLAIVIDQQTPAEPMIQFFQFEHLKEPLRTASRLFAQLATTIVMEIPRNAERTVSLRKLLESKDCAVRAMLFQQPGNITVRAEGKPQ